MKEEKILEEQPPGNKKCSLWEFLLFFQHGLPQRAPGTLSLNPIGRLLLWQSKIVFGGSPCISVKSGKIIGN